MALHGFVKCSDGRLYHPVIAEKAIDAWQHRVAQRDRAAKRWQREGHDTGKASAQPAAQPAAHPNAHATAYPAVMQGTGTVKGQGESPSLRSGENARATPPSLTAIPRDWQPSAQDRMHAALKCIPDPELAAEVEHFRDHYLAAGETRADWSAAFRAWLAKRRQFAKTPPNGEQPDKPRLTVAQQTRLAEARGR